MIEEQEKPEKENAEAELESADEPTEPTGEDDGIDDGCGKNPPSGGSGGN